MYLTALKSTTAPLIAFCLFSSSDFFPFPDNHFGFHSEQAFQVLRNGMDALEESARNEYVTDFKGFITYVREKGFQAYADKVGVLRNTVGTPI